MADPQPSREEQIREVLMNAVEVQLAALKAGASFWKEWMERTSAFVKTATKTLSSIRSQDKDASQLLLEIVDQARESMRTMTELPRNAAARFIQELDELERKRKAGPAGGARGKAGGSRRARPASRPRRRAHVKP
jgi:hypothetical protein